MKTRSPARESAWATSMKKICSGKNCSRALEEKNFLLTNYFKEKPLDEEEIAAQYLAFAEKIKPYVADTSLILDREIKQGKKVLFEGAQGSHLDIDHGTYPYVTSSNTVSANASCGSGIGPNAISKVVGICKAYTTRVGEGPFPTELKDDYRRSHAESRSGIRRDNRQKTPLRLAGYGAGATGSPCLRH